MMLCRPTQPSKCAPSAHAMIPLTPRSPWMLHAAEASWKLCGRYRGSEFPALRLIRSFVNAVHHQSEHGCSSGTSRNRAVRPAPPPNISFNVLQRFLRSGWPDSLDKRSSWHNLYFCCSPQRRADQRLSNPDLRFPCCIYELRQTCLPEISQISWMNIKKPVLQSSGE